MNLHNDAVLANITQKACLYQLEVDRPSAGCPHAQTDLGMPIDKLCTLCNF